MITTNHHMIILFNACQKLYSPCLPKFTKKKQSETPATAIGRSRTRRAEGRNRLVQEADEDCKCCQKSHDFRSD